MPSGDEQAGGRAVHLDHRVVGGGGAVDDDVEVAAEVAEVEPEPLGELLDAAHHADGLVLERRRRLVEHDLAFGRHADEVGERPPDVTPDPVARRRHAGSARRDSRSSLVAVSSTASVRSSSEPVEHDAVVALGAVDRHVLVEHVVEHGLRIAVERIAPTATAAVVVVEPLPGRHRHPVGGVLHDERVVGLVADRQLVRLARLAAADARHRVLHPDDVRVDLRRHPDFLDVVAAAQAAPLPGAAGVGAVVALPLHVRVQALVDLGGRLPQVAERGVLRTPRIHALRRVAPAGVHLGRVVGERLTRARDRRRRSPSGCRSCTSAARPCRAARAASPRAMTSPTSAPGWCVPARHRLARRRVEHAAGRHDELDRVEEAFVLRDLRIHHRGDLGDRVPAGVAERRPRLQLGPRVAAGVVDDQPVAVDGDLHVQVHVGMAERIVVDVAVAFVDAVGPRARPPRRTGGPRSRS